MPATVVDEPLGVSCVFSDGTRARLALGEDAVSALARQLMRGLADLVHPHGNLDSQTTVRFYLTSTRHMLRSLQQLGFAGDAGQLTRAKLTESWMGLASRYESHTRAILRSLDDLDGVLTPKVRQFVDGRPLNPRLRRNRRSLPAYTEAEWARLVEVCETAVATSYAAHRRALAEAERGQDLETGCWTRQNVQWTLRHRGPEAVDLSRRRGGKARARALKALYPGGALDAVPALFPGADTVLAYRYLLGVRTGIVPDGLTDLGLGNIDWAGDSSILLDYVKGRTAKETLTLSRTAVRLLEQWLDHSALNRQFAPPTERDALWLRYCCFGSVRWATDRVDAGTRTNWARRQGLVDDEGQPWHIHSHRIRTTFEASRDRRLWRGSARATIDPNHSPAVEGDHYLTSQTPTQKVATESIIEDAQHDLLRRARPPVVLTDEDTAAALNGFPQLVDQLDLDDEALADLVGGVRDVYAAACADQLAGLHGPKGKPCPARPWVCLLCPLAVFAPRHVPNLMRLRAFFTRQWQQMSTGSFMAVFGAYAQRLDELLTPAYFAEAVLRQAAVQVTDTDAELPLRPEETTASASPKNGGSPICPASRRSRASTSAASPG
jgi:hypothetical protein